nr:MAG TPA_asm: hypothetical protein [Caudoviricetes sp.]
MCVVAAVAAVPEQQPHERRLRPPHGGSRSAGAVLLHLTSQKVVCHGFLFCLGNDIPNYIKIGSALTSRAT